MGDIRAVFKCDEKDREKFSESQCLITISVGQDSHEGERFAALADLINNHFKSCIIILDDSLQRHTMALWSDKNSDFFYPHSIKEGDLWISRHEKILQEFTILKKIIRWDAWLNHPDFLKQRQKILDLIEVKNSYRKAFEESIESFLKKFYRRVFFKKFDMNETEEHCWNFVIEECVALSLWPELNCEFEVYPNQHNLAINETRKYFVLSQYPKLLRGIQVNLKNSSNLKPQHFFSLRPELAFV